MRYLFAPLAHWRLGLGLVVAAAYALFSHWLMLHAADKPWAVAALLGPLLAAGLGVAIKRRDLRITLAAVLAALGLAGVVARGGVADVSRLYLLQHAGIHLALFLTFVATLQGGREALISRVARRMHGTLTAPLAAYTRGVTLVWAIYFAAMSLLSVTVYATLPWSAWSLLANLLTPAAIVSLFVGEHVLRYRLHPEFERVGVAEIVRAYSHREAASPRNPP